jgi:ankyrin repeat domain-containing protein 50
MKNYRRHQECQCNFCKETFFFGERYQCITCPKYNLCHKCRSQNKHEHDFKVHIVCETQLFEYCYQGNLEELKKFQNFQQIDSVGWNSSFYAAEGGQLKILEFLKEKGVNLQKKASDGFSPILCASFNGHVDVVDWLLQNGSSIDESETKKYSNLMYAAWNGHLELVKFLLKNGCSLTLKGLDGYTPIHTAAEGGHTEIIKYLIINGASINEKANDGFTPLLSAAYCGHLETLQWLINHGANLTEKSSDGLNALYVAIESSNFNVANWLLDTSDLAEDDVIMGHECSVLMFSAATGQIDYIGDLLAKGHPINRIGRDGCCPILCASITGQIDCVNYLIRHGSSLKIRNGITGRNPLQTAAHYGQLETVKWILSKGGRFEEISEFFECNPSVLNSFKETIYYKIQQESFNPHYYKIEEVLQLCVLNGDLNLLKNVLDKNFDKLNSKDQDGNTILHLSIIFDQINIFLFLMKLDVNHQLKNNEKFTPMEVAFIKGDFEILSTFLKQKSVKHFSHEDWKRIYSLSKTNPAVVQYLKKLKIFHNQNFEDVEFKFQNDKKRKFYLNF